MCGISFHLAATNHADGITIVHGKSPYPACFLYERGAQPVDHVRCSASQLAALLQWWYSIIWQPYF